MIQQYGAWYSEDWRTYVEWSFALMVAAAREVWSGAAQAVVSPVAESWASLRLMLARRDEARRSKQQSPPGSTVRPVDAVAPESQGKRSAGGRYRREEEVPR